MKTNVRKLANGICAAKASMGSWQMESQEKKKTETKVCATRHAQHV